MPGDWFPASGARIPKDAVSASFPFERAPVLFEMADEFTALHAGDLCEGQRFECFALGKLGAGVLAAVFDEKEDRLAE